MTLEATEKSKSAERQEQKQEGGMDDDFVPPFLPPPSSLDPLKLEELMKDGIPAPPCFNYNAQKKIEYRDGDIIISVPGKSGTTWTMNIVHQLRSGGDPDFEDVYVEVPWLEALQHPGQTEEELIAVFDEMPTDDHQRGRRAFKTHAAPPGIPFFAAGGGDGDTEKRDVKYVVVVRNPEEALTSFKPFLEGHSPEWMKLWNMPHMKFPSFKVFYDKMVIQFKFYQQFFEFMSKWWPLRHEENVLFMHFNELKSDHEGSIRRISEFLGFNPSEEEFKKVFEYTSFAWMKENGEKFEMQKSCCVPVLLKGSMVRKGEIGKAHEDGWTEEMSEEVKVLGKEILKDDEAFEWMYTGKKDLLKCGD